MEKNSSMKWLMFPLLVLFALPVFAQTATIAVINSQRVLRESVTGKKVISEVEQLAKRREEEIRKRDASIRAMKEKLAKQADISTKEFVEQTTDQIRKDERALRDYATDSEDEVKRKYLDALNKIQSQVRPLIKKLGEERGYSIILDIENLVYFNAKIDITDELIKLLDASTSQVAPPKTQ